MVRVRENKPVFRLFPSKRNFTIRYFSLPLRIIVQCRTGIPSCRGRVSEIEINSTHIVVMALVRLKILFKFHKPMGYLVACSANFARACLVHLLISCWNAGDVPPHIRLTARWTNSNSFAVLANTVSPRTHEQWQVSTLLGLMPVLHILKPFASYGIKREFAFDLLLWRWLNNAPLSSLIF